MREIKFRGFEKESGLWRIGSLLVVGEKCYIVQFIQGEEVRWEVDPSTVGRSTNKKDVNGNVAFEGDIIRWDGVPPHKFKAPVQWNEKWGYFSPRDIFDGWEFEIVGNIFDNKEPLKV